MEYSFLQDLNNDNDSWMIRIRICRIWESTNTKKNDELISLDMIFIDEKENVMHATIRKIFVSKFKNLLSEGSLYSVKNFKVIPSTGEYRPVSTAYKIIFHRNTLVMKLEEGSIKIPTHGFQFISQNLIDSRVNDHTILSDVVGCLCGVGDLEIVSGDYVASLIERFSTVINGVQDIGSSNVNKVSLEEEMFINRMSIKELLEAEWDDKLKEYKVTIKAKIIGIDTTFGWYKIHIKVKDKSGETTFVLFNVIAEKLLDTSVKKLLPTNNNDVPAVIQALRGKDFVYKLRLNDYNLRDGYENFTVSKIFEPNDILEQAHESKKEKDYNLEDEDVDDTHVTGAGESRKRKLLILDDEDEEAGDNVEDENN
ncbi:uncharacterized protein LOC133035947 [Cannabis sativa]|uniref:uncharacterized protein LOC133035947 n=1 Tax=Cannabis sativa TaxID=3483 RepID=UPI0029CA1CDE|nr:uncharacterized protein LOC133035947 [Cannabis sativa]